MTILISNNSYFMKWPFHHFYLILNFKARIFSIFKYKIIKEKIKITDCKSIFIFYIIKLKLHLENIFCSKQKKRLINYSELDSNFFSPKASHTQLTHAIFANNLTWTIFACLKMRCFDCCWTKNQLSGYGLKLQLLHIGRLENCSLWNFKLPNFKIFFCFTMCNFSFEW